MDEGSVQKDGDFFYARPLADAAETEEAINSSGICIQYVVPMYSVCTCMYVHVCAMYVHGLISCLNSHP